MKLVRVPLRISFAGGGSDIPSHYEENGGAVVSTTIDKYIYITAKRNVSLFPHKYRLVYSKVEECNEPDQIEHRIIKALIKEHGVESLDLDVMSDVPAGTGLGSSSAFTVGLHTALSSEPQNKHALADWACYTEINQLKEPIGKQDQYAAAFGGLNYFNFRKSGVDVRPIVLTETDLFALKSRLYLVYVGGTRKASEILEGQTKPDNAWALRDAARLADQATTALVSRHVDSLGPIIKDGWELKKCLSSSISNERVDEIIGGALLNGATGGKLLGAGGAGFVLLFCPPKDKLGFLEALKHMNATPIPFNFDMEGCKVLYED